MKNFICMVAFVVVSMGSFLNAKKQNVVVADYMSNCIGVSCGVPF